MHSRQPTSVPRHLRLIALAAALLASACGSDSGPLPFEPSPACPFTMCTQDGRIPQLVIQPLDDAISRLVPNLGNQSVRKELASSLIDLRTALDEGKDFYARLALARSHDHLGRAELAGGPDLPDLSAIRLSLVLSAAALGMSSN